MRRICIVLLVLSVFVGSCSCVKTRRVDNNSQVSRFDDPIGTMQEQGTTDENPESENVDDHNCLSDVNIVYIENENYIICSNEEFTIVYYAVYDDEGHVMDQGYDKVRGACDISEENNLLVMKQGSGGAVWLERYYDTAGGRVSKFFESPVQHTDELVAYFAFRKADNKIVLVIQDIFDPQKYYREIERDFSNFVINMNVKAEFIEDDTKLKITYWVNPDNKKVTEIMDIDSYIDSFNSRDHQYEIENSPSEGSNDKISDTDGGVL